MSNKDLAHHITHYRNIFIYLLIGTALTVAASYLEFNVKDSIAGAVFVGLTIATIKGYLVAANFMHLNSEKKNNLLDTNVNGIFSCFTSFYSSFMGY